MLPKISWPLILKNHPGFCVKCTGNSSSVTIQISVDHDLLKAALVVNNFHPLLIYHLVRPSLVWLRNGLSITNFIKTLLFCCFSLRCFVERCSPTSPVVAGRVSQLLQPHDDMHCLHASSKQHDKVHAHERLDFFNISSRTCSFNSVQ